MKTKVWTLSIRIFHWLLAIGFCSAYILGDMDEYPNLHYAFGLFVGSLILFRILYGLIGNRYANFTDFPVSLRSQISFITGFRNNKPYIGHNPAASLVMLGIFVVGILCSISGYMLYSVESGSILAFNEDILEEGHEVIANLFLILVIIHLAGLLTDLVFHRKANTLQSIFTGYKNVEGENSSQNAFHTIFSVIWFIVPFAAFIYGNNLSDKDAGSGKTEYYDTESMEHENDENHD